MDLIPDGHPDKQVCFRDLGATLLIRFDCLGDLADLEAAIPYQAKAAELIPEDHPEKARELSVLGTSWLCLFERQGKLEDVENAIQFQMQAATNLTPDDHPLKPGYLFELGSSYLARYNSLNAHADLEAANHMLKSGAASAVTSPNIRMQCARKWAATSILLNSSPLEAYNTVFTVLPSLVWLGQTPNSRYFTLTSVSGLVPEAVAWAISVKLYDTALEWLEQGCSVIWGQTLQFRTPFEELAILHPDIAYELREVASQLDSTGSSPRMSSPSSTITVDLEAQAQHHHAFVLHWEKLLTRVRQLPGFSDFLRPKKAHILKKAAKDGPIVVINTHSTRYDALVVLPGSDDVVHVPLKLLSQNQSNSIRTCSAVMYRDSREGCYDRGVTRRIHGDRLEPLSLLWSNVVFPVLNALSHTEKQTFESLPHITWCATGALAFMPLHAAGLYDGRSPNAFDLVVSSYTPTVSALLSRAQLDEPDCSLLAVGQDASPKLSPLPKTVEELKMIKQHIDPSRYYQLTGASATISATLRAMEEHSWVHFACHATQDRLNPRHSSFHLYDGMLTLEEIANRTFKNKGLAFLSACQTATRDDSLPDEAINLATGMLMVGYQSVIAALWSIQDRDAPDVARIVYAELTKSGRMDHTHSARALHKAVARLREAVGVEMTERWASFIHMGV